MTLRQAIRRRLMRTIAHARAADPSSSRVGLLTQLRFSANS